MAERGHRGLAWACAAYVDHQQAKGPSDRRVGTVAWSENAESAVEADMFADRAVDEDERRREVGRGRHPVKVELRVAGALGGGHDHGQILGPTPGQDGVDSSLLDG
jgi:hypothetical protein